MAEINIGMIEFDGYVMKYPNGNKIYIEFDGDEWISTYDVYNSDDEPLCLSMCLLHQAHSVAVGDK